MAWVVGASLELRVRLRLWGRLPAAWQALPGIREGIVTARGTPPLHRVLNRHYLVPAVATAVLSVALQAKLGGDPPWEFPVAYAVLLTALLYRAAWRSVVTARAEHD